MRTTILAALLLGALAAIRAQELTGGPPLERARAASGDLLGTLKTTLVRHLQQKGPGTAFTVCADSAQLLTETIAAHHKVRMRRVSLRWRNPLDEPDDHERAVLEEFARLLQAGTLSETTEHVAVSTGRDGRVFRYMRPIVIQKPCLSCHAQVESLGVDVREARAQYYPDDRATGYVLGELRGAVSVQLLIH
jgi:hypothetical protein